MIFLCKKNKNFLRQHCSRFQDTRLCPIWAYLDKLCHECGHNIRHLARKPWIFIDDSSFLRTLFQENWRIPSLYFFVLTRSHIMTPREGFPFICFFIEFRMPISIYGQNGGHDRSYLGVESWENFVVSMMKWILVNLKLKFSKNHKKTMRHL